MDMHLFRYVAPLFILFLIGPGSAAAQGYPGYPNTIMTPERGAIRHHRAQKFTREVRKQPEQVRQTPSTRQARPNIAIARGSSGSVLPTPLPRTPLIPPEGGGMSAVPATPQLPGATVLPGLTPIPNLPHGAETFQDRASRCAFQQGLYNVPGDRSTQYLGACVQ